MKTNLISLKAVAPELQPLLRAFRETGLVAIEQIPLNIARENYIQSSMDRGLLFAMDSIEEIICPVDQGEITLRIYRAIPDTKKPLPFIAYFHGGGWVIGDLESHDRVCRYIAQRSGLPVIAVDYRMAPEHKFPIPLNDCVAALKYLCQQHIPLRIDKQRIILAGDSTGGNLATVLSHQYSDLFHGKVIAEILIYPVTDLTTNHPSYDRITEGFPLTANTMHYFIENYLNREDDRKNPSASPLFATKQQASIHTFIATVGLDPLCDEGVAYATKRIQEGSLVEHLHLPEQMHGIITYTSKIEASRRILDNACSFIQRAVSKVF